MSNSTELKKALLAFGLDPKKYTLEPIKSGHINTSYAVVNKDDNRALFFLQKINSIVFNDIDNLMKNTIRTTEIINSSQSDEIFTPTFIKTKNNNVFYTSDTNENYRLSDFIEHYEPLSMAKSDDSIYQGGLAFGIFIDLLKNTDYNQFHTIIPDFHNINYRLKNLQNSIKKHTKKVNSSVKNLLEIVNDLSHNSRRIQNNLDEKKIPIRVTHNDTKLDNILAPAKLKNGLLCVVDLDTVMPSSLLFDFGDSIRSLISYTDEDYPEKYPVELNLNAFSAYNSGFMESVNSFIEPQEYQLMPEAVVLLPFLMGVRFLTDYINGNKYFSVNYENHNLDRAFNQLHLAKTLAFYNPLKP